MWGILGAEHCAAEERGAGAAAEEGQQRRGARPAQRRARRLPVQ